MRFVLFVLFVFGLLFGVAQAGKNIDITPKNAKEYGVSLEFNKKEEGYEVRVHFPKNYNGLDGFATVNVAHDPSDLPKGETGTIQVPQYSGLSVFSGKLAGLKYCFLVITFVNENQEIEKVMSLKVNDWIKEKNL